jgi:hypothetical protein
LKSSSSLSNLFFVELVRFQPEEALTWLPSLPTSSPLAPFNDTRDKLRFFPMPLSPQRLGSRLGAFAASRALSPMDDHRPTRRAASRDTKFFFFFLCILNFNLLKHFIKLFLFINYSLFSSLNFLLPRCKFLCGKNFLYFKFNSSHFDNIILFK